ncbi:hypothetical protein GA0116948_11170 [Chitinophaga costaii]|uniref:Uncharacterized protein n=1 Tax=Chitinophaga costaii TaxID=1335309 RepID=A0A1C4F2K9_9BACT|nr:hypothetical protein [Chitinophaga costaii]PUZ22115.1 hypothetical protein DCM91_15430 [Chitinophaga costaii]SCC50180.1 hypothetical protein GA0116948_11170 [Chitinophaga costaii]
MQELIDKIKAEAGITEEQAHKALGTVKEYVKSKLPAGIAGTVESWFSNFGQKVAEKKDDAADYLEQAKDKAEDWAHDLKDKVSGLFNNGEEEKK